MQAELRTEVLPSPGPDQVRVRALQGAISRGTEALVLRGGVPQAVADQMRAPFQQGSFPWPVKYGYQSVGVIEAGAGPVGQRVFCLFPHQDRYVLPAHAAVPIPHGVPTPRATLAANMETALNAVWDLDLAPGAAVAVVGAGVVGLLTGHLLCRLAGARVSFVDTNPQRAPLCAALGGQFFAPAHAPPDQDAVVHTSATEAGLHTALGLCGFEAPVLEMSWYGEQSPRVPLGGAFHQKRLRLICSQVGQVAPTRRHDTTHRQRLAQALALLDDPALDALVLESTPFATLPERLVGLAQDPRGALAVRVCYSEISAGPGAPGRTS